MPIVYDNRSYDTSGRIVGPAVVAAQFMPVVDGRLFSITVAATTAGSIGDQIWIMSDASGQPGNVLETLSGLTTYSQYPMGTLYSGQSSLMPVLHHGQFYWVAVPGIPSNPATLGSWATSLPFAGSQGLVATRQSGAAWQVARAALPCFSVEAAVAGRPRPPANLHAIVK